MEDVAVEDVRFVRSVLRLRLKREALQAPLTSTTSASALEKVVDGGLVATMQLEQLFQRTVQFGENQSGLLLGAVGSDRRAIVLHAMRDLRSKFGDFTLVYLNGVILQNELEAFKEFTAQLTRTTAVKHPVLPATSRFCLYRLLVAKAKVGIFRGAALANADTISPVHGQLNYPVDKHFEKIGQ